MKLYHLERPSIHQTASDSFKVKNWNGVHYLEFDLHFPLFSNHEGYCIL